MKFPEDPCAPKITYKPNNKANNVWDRVEKFALIISMVLSMISLFYAVVSFKLSKATYVEAKKQFEQSSISSDIQFKKVFKILNAYEKTGENTLTTSKLQLDATKELLNLINTSGQPIFSLLQSDWQTGNYSSQGESFNFMFTFHITNSGKRPLKNLVRRITVFNKNFSIINQNLHVGSNNLMPNVKEQTYYLLNLNEDIKNIFLHIRFEYNDIFTFKGYNPKLYADFFLKPLMYQGKQVFMDVQENEKSSMVRVLNSKNTIN
jgi:hypothetical protein